MTTKPGKLIGIIAGIVFLMLATMTTANAASSYLCKGFSSCTSKSYSNAGYSSVYTKSFWGQTAGHNCTNYVAYRLNSNGRKTTKPAGTIGASTWGPAAKSAGIYTTTSSPKVGDVAYYAKGTKFSSSGHVAYVEKVSGSTIYLSEDNYGGDYDWRSITAGDQYYPSYFIRYPKAP